jgi:orotidine-5'-phosphate decarboxylase
VLTQAVRPSSAARDLPARERLIFALDVPSANEARQLVELLGDSVHFYKLGLQLFTARGYFELLDWLLEKEKKIFVDLKLYDVPETVRLAVRQLSVSGAHFATVHGEAAIMQAACGEKGGLKILAVTVLTSLDQNDIAALGFQCSVTDLVLSRAKRAFEIGCDGVIASGAEAQDLRAQCGERLLIVTPGIRTRESRATDDQKRVVTVEQAFRNGADYIVVGRPIRDASAPRAAAQNIQRQIAAIFAS